MSTHSRSNRLVANEPHSSVDIPMSEGPVNLNWGPIMKQINESPHDFFHTGGWTFLGSGDDNDVRTPRAPPNFANVLN